MRIGISCYPTHGGSGVVATELGKHLAERGHEVSFISYSSPLRLAQRPPGVCYHEVTVEEYPLLKQYPYGLALASKMVEVARTHDLEVLHAHYAIPFAAAAVLARLMLAERKLKVVTTLHGTDISLVGGNRSFRPVTAFSIESSDAVTAVSSYLRAETYRVFGIQRDIAVIPNFVDPQRYAPGPGRPATPTLVHISNFRPVKRAKDVVEVFRRVAARTDARLALVGDGPDMSEVIYRIEQHGLQDRVTYHGVVDEVAPILSQAHLFLLPSESESFGLAALEAMAAGVPPVASRVGGLPEVVEDGVSGYLCPLGDVESMAGRCVELLSDASLLARFSAAARERAATQFHFAPIVARYEELYAQVIAGRGPPVNSRGS
jgi:L-malate glycosyltransferase